MRTSRVLSLGLGIGIALAAGSAVRGPLAPTVANAQPSLAVARLAQSPLSFEANHGQTDPSVRFLTRGTGYHVWVQPTALTLMVAQPEKQKSPAEMMASKSGKSAVEPVDHSPEAAVVRMKLVGANPKAKLQGESRLPGVSNYFIGNDRSKWCTNVPRFAKVSAKQVYPGVDLLYYGTQKQLEYDFRVKPGADPNNIRLHFDGADRLEVNAAGDLVVHVGGGSVEQHKPVVYQEQNGRRVEVAGNFVMKDPFTVGFQLAAYDHSRDLVVDPVLGWGAYLGGNDDDLCSKVVGDSSGNIYVTGGTISSNFPEANSPHGTAFTAHNLTWRDVFITKIKSDGSAILYSTFFGGSNVDEGFGIALDGSGNIVVGGNTKSVDFPRVKPVQNVAPVGAVEDGFVIVVAANGQSLIFSTPIVGSNYDVVWSVKADSSNNVYAVGWTQGGIPVSAAGVAYSAAFNGGSYDAFLWKIAPPVGAGNATLTYGTYYGGGGDDFFEDVVVDNAGNAVCGGMASSGFPTTLGSAFAGTYDVAVTKFITTNTGAASRAWSRYLGGSARDQCNAMVSGGSGSVWLTGQAGAGFPEVGALQSFSAGRGQDAFLTKLDSSGAIVCSTSIGGTGTENSWGVGIDSSGRVSIAGTTTGSLTTISPFQASYAGGLTDGFLAQVNTNASGFTTISYISYYGGNLEDQVRGAYVDSNGALYVSGYTYSSTGIGTTGSFQATKPAVLQFPKVAVPADGFVAKAGSDNPPVANPDAYSATEEQTLTVITAVGVLANDTDPDVGDTLSVGSVTTPPAHAASFTMNSDGSFSYTPANLYFGVDTFQYTAKDSFGVLSSPTTVTITISAVNHAPTITRPATRPGSEDTDVTFQSTYAISVADVDYSLSPGGSTEQVTVSIPSGKGTLTVTASGSATLDTNNTNSILITGTLVELNNTLSTLVYHPLLNLNGNVTLSIHADDLGHTNGAALTADATVTITLAAVNDAPSITRPASVSGTEDTSIVLNGGNLISVADIDFLEAAGGAYEVLTASVTHGVLTPAGGSGAMVTGSGTAAITVQGTLVQINAALNGLTFTPTLNYNGSATLSLAIDDQGNFGSGGAKMDAKSVAITLSAVNDAPVITRPVSISATEDTPLTINGGNAISVADVDFAEAPANSYEILTITAGHGTLQPHDSTASVGGSGTATLTIQGTPAQINTALLGMIYTPALNYNNSQGTDTLTITINDQGNAGSGGAGTDSKTVSIDVSKVNDAPTISGPLTEAVPNVPYSPTYVPSNPINIPRTSNYAFTGPTAVSLADIDFLEGGGSGVARIILVTHQPFGDYSYTLGGVTKEADYVDTHAYHIQQLRGTLAQLNTLLSTLRYQPNQYYVGYTYLGIVVSDDGNSGSGGILYNSFEIAINVTLPPAASPAGTGDQRLQGGPKKPKKPKKGIRILSDSGLDQPALWSVFQPEVWYTRPVELVSDRRRISLG